MPTSQEQWDAAMIEQRETLAKVERLRGTPDSPTPPEMKRAFLVCVQLPADRNESLVERLVTALSQRLMSSEPVGRFEVDGDVLRFRNIVVHGEHVRFVTDLSRVLEFNFDGWDSHAARSIFLNMSSKVGELNLLSGPSSLKQFQDVLNDFDCTVFVERV